MTTLTNKTRTTNPSFMRRQEGIGGATPVRPHFSPELASLDPKPNHERLAEYVAKRTNRELAA